MQHNQRKHVEVNRHFIKENIEEGKVELPFVQLENQSAHILTKRVSERIFDLTLCKLDIGDPTTQLERGCNNRIKSL